jgi:chromosome segregation ATPase
MSLHDRIIELERQVLAITKAKIALEETLENKTKEYDKLAEAKMTIEDTLIDTENKEESIIDNLEDRIQLLENEINTLTDENNNLKEIIKEKDKRIDELSSHERKHETEVRSEGQPQVRSGINSAQNNSNEMADLKKDVAYLMEEVRRLKEIVDGSISNEVNFKVISAENH